MRATGDLRLPAVRYHRGMHQESTPEHRSRAARALVVLHERHLREFLVVWRRARAAGVMLPRTDDPDYASLETLLFHVLRAARGYLTWMCEQLALPDPGIDAPPPVERVAGEADAYLEHLLARWRTALVDVAPERLEDRAYPSRWGTPYSVDAMLEHAVMHPIRHAFQLDNLLGEQAPAGG